MYAAPAAPLANSQVAGTHTSRDEAPTDTITTAGTPWYPETMTAEPLESGSTRAISLSSDLSDPQAVPYFLWDEPMTVAELREKLRTASPPERTRLMGKILREARDTEVWMFTTPAEVARSWRAISRNLGRRREFWEFLLRSWSQQGRLDVDWAQ
jgi:hypothetical protein